MNIEDDDAKERHGGDLPNGGREEEDGHQLPSLLEPGNSLWLLRGHRQLRAGRHLDALLREARGPCLARSPLHLHPGHLLQPPCHHSASYNCDNDGRK